MVQPGAEPPLPQVHLEPRCQGGRRCLLPSVVGQESVRSLALLPVAALGLGGRVFGRPPTHLGQRLVSVGFLPGLLGGRQVARLPHSHRLLDRPLRDLVPGASAVEHVLHEVPFVHFVSERRLQPASAMVCSFTELPCVLVPEEVGRRPESMRSVGEEVSLVAEARQVGQFAAAFHLTQTVGVARVHGRPHLLVAGAEEVGDAVEVEAAADLEAEEEASGSHEETLQEGGERVGEGPGGGGEADGAVDHVVGLEETLELATIGKSEASPTMHTVFFHLTSVHAISLMSESPYTGLQPILKISFILRSILHQHASFTMRLAVMKFAIIDEIFHLFSSLHNHAFIEDADFRGGNLTIVLEYAHTLVQPRFTVELPVILDVVVLFAGHDHFTAMVIYNHLGEGHVLHLWILSHYRVRMLGWRSSLVYGVSEILLD